MISTQWWREVTAANGPLTSFVLRLGQSVWWVQGSTRTTVKRAVWSQLPGNAGNHRGEGQSWLAKTHRGAPFVGGMDNILDQFTSKELCDIGGFPGNGRPLLLQCVQLSTGESALNRPALLGCPPPAFCRSVFCCSVSWQSVFCILCSAVVLLSLPTLV